MNITITNNLVKKEALITALEDMGIVSTDARMTESFKVHAGMVIKTLEVPKGVLIVGRVHLYDHITIIAKGSIKLLDEIDGVHEDISAASVLGSEGNDNKIFIALEDTVIINITVNELGAETQEEYIERYTTTLKQILKEV